MMTLLLVCVSLALAEPPIPASGPDDASVVQSAEPAESTESAESVAQPYPLLYAGQVTPETSRHWDLEVMYHEHRYKEGLALAEQRLAADETDPEAAWHIVRFMYELGEADKTLDKLAWYREMVRVADLGLKHHPDDRHLRFARGVANGRYGTTRGVLASLFLAKTIERDWLMAGDGSFEYSSIGGAEQLPCDAWHAIGIFYRLVPDWWIVKVLAGTRGDLDASLSWHEKANERCPNRVWNLKELGATELCIGAKRGEASMTERGLAHLREAILAPGESGTSAIDRKHSQMLIDDPTLACEYSRDGQQDLDKDKMAQ